MPQFTVRRIAAALLTVVAAAVFGLGTTSELSAGHSTAWDSHSTAWDSHSTAWD